MKKLDTDLGSLEAINVRRAELEAEFLALEDCSCTRAFEIAGELGTLSAEENYLKGVL